MLLRKIKVSPFILIRIFSFRSISYFCSIIWQQLPSITVFQQNDRWKVSHIVCLDQLINCFTNLVPPYLKLKVQFMKVVPQTISLLAWMLPLMLSNGAFHSVWLKPSFWRWLLLLLWYPKSSWWHHWSNTWDHKFGWTLKGVELHNWCHHFLQVG